MEITTITSSGGSDRRCWGTGARQSSGRRVRQFPCPAVGLFDIQNRFGILQGDELDDGHFLAVGLGGEIEKDAGVEFSGCVGGLGGVANEGEIIVAIGEGLEIPAEGIEIGGGGEVLFFLRLDCQGGDVGGEVFPELLAEFLLRGGLASSTRRYSRSPCGSIPLGRRIVAITSEEGLVLAGIPGTLPTR